MTATTNDTEAIRDRQTELKQRYRQDADAARVTSSVTSVTEPGQDPRRVKIAVDGPSGTVYDVSAHAAVGGFDDVACSGDLFLASLAACQEVTIRLVASALGLTLTRLDLRVEGDWDARGTLAVDREAPIGFTDIRLLIDIETEGPADRVERLLSSAERYCVIGATLKAPPAVEIRANVTTPQSGGDGPA